MYTLSQVRVALLCVSLSSLILGTMLGWWARWLHIKYKVRKNRATRCPVDGCRIRPPHSHTEALIRRMRNQ